MVEPRVDEDRIVWMASYPKSGSTWARLLLTAYHFDGRVNIDDMVSTTDVAIAWYQATSLRPITEIHHHERNMLRHAALLNMMAGTRYRPLVVKTHMANASIRGVDMIPLMLTRGAICVVRDPRDVAASFARHMGHTVDETIANMADTNYGLGGDHEIPQFVSSWSNHVRSWGAESLRTTLVRYEDMQADPVCELERMLAVCGIAAKKDRMRRAANACRLDRIMAQEDERGFTERSEHQDRFFGVGRGWRNELTDEQAARIEADHGETMRRLGYLSETRQKVAASGA